jgi:choline dehydrogenase-like flavoprotein
MKTFDYVIVGAGAAGCVLAYRLSENPSVSVALLEAGPGHKHPLIDMPKGLGKMLFNPKYTWTNATEPHLTTNNEAEHWLRGKVLGGSTSVNGMMYVRGQPADFDEIAARSSDDWSWRQIGAAYEALECHALGSGPSRGGRGPLRITLPAIRTALTEAMIKAGESMGLPRKQDVNAPDNEVGVGYAPVTIFGGKRQSAATAFLDPIRQRPNLTVITGAHVDRVLFTNRRATSVLARIGTRDQTIEARREVILCGGALASPLLLQRSGIGPSALLERHGIEVVQDSPEVGQNLIEHRGLIMQWKLSQPLSQNLELSGVRLLRVVAEYLFKKTGIMAAGTYEIGAWFRSRPDAPRPDIQLLLAPFSFDLATKRQKLEPFHGMHTVAYGLRPTSRGEILIRSRDPNDAPVLRPNYRTTAEDRQTMIDVVRTARRYAEQPALRAMIEAETYPGPNCESDDDIIAAYDHLGTCGYHAVGSCRMGSDAESVVDPELRVRGVNGLRVMDTSIIPQIPAGNTNGPTMAMAWRAADIIQRASA